MNEHMLLQNCGEHLMDSSGAPDTPEELESMHPPMQKSVKNVG